MFIAFAIAFLPGAAWGDDGKAADEFSAPQTPASSDAALVITPEADERESISDESADFGEEASEIDDHDASQDPEAENEPSDSDESETGENEATNPDATDDDATEDASDEIDASDAADISNKTDASGKADISGESSASDSLLIGSEDIKSAVSDETARASVEETPHRPNVKPAPLDANATSSPEAEPDIGKPDRLSVKTDEEDEAAAPSDVSLSPSDPSSWHATEVGQAAASLDPTPSWNCGDCDARDTAEPAIAPITEPSSHSNATRSSSGQEPFALPEEASQRAEKNSHSPELQALSICGEPFASSWQIGKTHLQAKGDASRRAQGPTRCRSPSRA